MRRKKKNNIRVTTTTDDRVQALIRNPEYLKDLNELTGTKTGKMNSGMAGGAKAFVERYNKFLAKNKITVPLYPEWVKKYPKETIETAVLFTDDFVANVIPHDEPRSDLRDGKYLKVEINIK